MDDPLIIAGHSYHSRLLVGTGKYASMAETKAVIEASGAEIITVAVRRMNLGAQGEYMEDVLDPTHYTYMPNTAGCYSAEDAIRTLRLAREAGAGTLVKLEVIGDPVLLYPDVQETLKAARILAQEGFHIMAYTSDDPVVARLLEEAGCVAVMPLASPIGSGLGIQNPRAIRTIVENAHIPVLVDAGIGTASDVVIAMELGCDGVLLNTALAEAEHPILMAEAMRYAVRAGRLTYRAGRMKPRAQASASSPGQGLIRAAT